MRSSVGDRSIFFWGRQLLLQGGNLGFQFLNTFGQLLGVLPPFFATFGYIVYPILKTFGVRLHLHILVLPVLPTTLQEPSLRPRRAFVFHRLIIVVGCVHADLLIRAFIEDLQCYSATKTPKPNKPK